MKRQPNHMERTVERRVSDSRERVDPCARGSQSLGRALFLSGGADRAAVWLCAVSVLLDAADGWIARRWHQETVLGTLIDPVADKIAMFVVFGTIARSRRVPRGVVAFRAWDSSRRERDGAALDPRQIGETRRRTRHGRQDQDHCAGRRRYRDPFLTRHTWTRVTRFRRRSSSRWWARASGSPASRGDATRLRFDDGRRGAWRGTRGETDKPMKRGSPSPAAPYSKGVCRRPEQTHFDYRQTQRYGW